MFKVGDRHINDQIIDGSNFWILESQNVKNHFDEESYTGRGYTDNERDAKLFIGHGAKVENYNIPTEPNAAQVMMTFVAKANEKPDLYGVWREDDRISDRCKSDFAFRVGKMVWKLIMPQFTGTFALARTKARAKARAKP
jgi:hypothetical protein